MTTNEKIFSLIGEYWDIAYQQGVEGRSHDNEAGDAQRVLSEITHALALLPREPHPNQIDRRKAADAAVKANHAYGQWISEHWLHLFLDAYEGKL